MIELAFILGFIIFNTSLVMRAQRSEDFRLELQNLLDERAGKRCGRNC